VGPPCVDRRDVLRALAGAAAAGALSRASFAITPVTPPLAKTIPSSGEKIAAVGLGTWITFNVGNDTAARDASAEVMRAFFAEGGRMVDSSPMYASSQDVVGYGLKKLGMPAVFAAEKVWTAGGARGQVQMEKSRRLWGIAKFDLMQVHNLLDWETHLPALFEMKASGKLRYVGITTSEGRRAREFEQIMRSQKLDFAQLTYNPVDRAAEARLLPLAQERGIAVIVNRPFQEGDLVRKLAEKKLPDFAAELGCKSWAQIVLKFIVSHPAVTVAIPATTRVDHVRENMAAARGLMPDAALRKRIADHIASL
jgi:diketogulonate reductase-like aldo/keto reductase